MQMKGFPSIMVLYILLRLLNTAYSHRKDGVSAFSFIDVLSPRLILLGQFALRWPSLLHTKHNFSFSGQSSVTWPVVPHWKHRLIWGADARPVVSLALDTRYWKKLVAPCTAQSYVMEWIFWLQSYWPVYCQWTMKRPGRWMYASPLQH